MAASYPGSKKTYSDKTAKVDLVAAADINSLQDEVEAIEAELGVDVAGSQTDLVTRLAVSLADSGGIRQGTSFPVSDLETGMLFYRTDEDVIYIYNGAGWTSQSLTSAAGDVLQSSADTERSEGGTTYVKVKEIQLPRSGTYRVKFDMKVTGSTNTAYARVYKNGAAHGTEQTSTWAEQGSASVYQNKSEDISGWTSGDLCQLYIKVNGSPDDCYIQNFRIYESSGVDYIVNTD